MSAHNSVTLSPLIQNVLTQVLAQENLKADSLAQAVARLSHMFTKERESVGRPYLEDHELASAYLQYYLPVNLAKVTTLLDEMPMNDRRETFSVLDVGVGPGTGALAVLDWCHHKDPETQLMVTAVDASSAAIRQAQRLWQMVCQVGGITNARLHHYEGDIERIGCFEKVTMNGPYDLIILANSLNEIAVAAQDPLSARTQVLSRLLDVLTPHGTVMIVEPALRQTSRALFHVRDQLVQAGRCTVYSPCLHERNCPALVNPLDWCHEERPWEPPPHIRAIDKEVGFIKDALKFSYLLLRKDGKTIINRQQDIYRVVSELRVMKGEKRAWLCNEMGRQEVGRQDRLVSDRNAPFDQWKRGDIVQIETISHKERHGKVSALGRIEQDTAVQIIRSV